MTCTVLVKGLTFSSQILAAASRRSAQRGRRAGALRAGRTPLPTGSICLPSRVTVRRERVELDACCPVDAARWRWVCAGRAP